MGNPLLHTDLALLRALAEDGGFSTRDAAERAGLQVGRRHTALWRQGLLHLQRLGLVASLDGEKPIAWARTPAGTAELAERDAADPSPTPLAKGA